MTSEDQTTAGAAAAQEPSLTEQARQLSEQAMENYQALEEQAGAIKEQATQINAQVTSFIQNNPAVAIAGAFGLGYLIGSVAARRWII